MLWFFWGASHGRWEYPMVGYVLGLGMNMGGPGGCSVHMGDGHVLGWVYL